MVEKFDLKNILSTPEEKERIFQKELQEIYKREHDAVQLQDDLARDKELERIAYQYAAMGMFDKSLAILKTLTKGRTLTDTITPGHGIRRLVEFLDKDRLDKFSDLGVS